MRQSARSNLQTFPIAITRHGLIGLPTCRAGQIATSLTYREPARLLITVWDIWPDSENWHLYHKLRRSYGDARQLYEAPGHYFLKHEIEDLAGFLQLAMLNGWGGYLLTERNGVNLFFSHDEWIDFYAEDEAGLVEVRKMFEQDFYWPA